VVPDWLVAPVCCDWVLLLLLLALVNLTRKSRDLGLKFSVLGHGM
jgi:hypothetical protein